MKIFRKRSINHEKGQVTGAMPDISNRRVIGSIVHDKTDYTQRVNIIISLVFKQ